MATRDAYTIYISNYSPYSIKAMAILGWAGLDVGVQRSNMLTRETILKKMTGKTMVPMLRKGAWAINDSTRIARFAIERSARPILPGAEGARALCWLLEEFADEWVSRWFIYERWHVEENRRVLASEIGEELVVGVPWVSDKVGNMAADQIAKMTGRAGAAPANDAALTMSRDRTLAILESILASGSGFLFGSSPTVADFGFYGPIEQYRRDPGGSARLSEYPCVCGWLTRLRAFEVPGGNRARHEIVGEDKARDVTALSPLLDEFAQTYWRVLIKNHEVASRAERAKRAEVALAGGQSFSFAPAGYSIKRLGEVLDVLERLAQSAPQLLEATPLFSRELEAGLSSLKRYESGRELLKTYPALTAR